MDKEFSESRKSFGRRTFLKGVFGVGTLITLEGCTTMDTSATDPTYESQPQSAEFETTPSWEQDFSKMPNGPIDNATWRHELDPEVPTYNDEAQAYTSSERNVRIEDGKLVIEAHREVYKYPGASTHYEFTSGRIDTRDSFDFEYGKYEVTMKLPAGSGTWPAFWFLSGSQPFTDALSPTDEDWAEPRFYMHNGELDAMEAYGDRPGFIEGTLHAFNESTAFEVNDVDTSAFHTYGVEVAPTKLVWTLDGEVYGTLEKPSDNPDDWPFGGGNRFYAILNLAMGSVAGEIDANQDSWRMEVQDARFFEFIPADS
jgi:beta-glucanase (GH16 family)